MRHSLLLLLLWVSVVAQAQTVFISIILDDMGGRLAEGRRVLQLPAPIACAFLPLAPYTQQLAQEAHLKNKEVLLHLPMQAMQLRRLDRGGVTLDMHEAEFLRVLREDIKRIPHIVGINNHMGSLLTQHPGHMQWLMDEMGRQKGLFFIDSRTTHASVAYRLAQENNIPSAQRDVFLDSEQDVVKIERQFDALIRQAKKTGYAIAIGHPYPETLSVLEKRLTQLDKNIKVIPIAQILPLYH